MGYEVLHSPSLWALLSMEDQRAQSERERDTIARYCAAYYRELRSLLSGRSYGVDTLPSHLMPWKKNVYVNETRDGHFIVNHVSNPIETYSDAYEDYLHTVPQRAYTLREYLKPRGLQFEEGTQLFRRQVFGKRLGDQGFDQVQKGNYLERADIITRNRVSRLSEEESRRHAREDLRRYLP